MFSRLLRIQTEVNRIDEVAMLFEESVVPLCKGKKGYKGSYFLSNRETGNGVLITLWNSEEDMRATEETRFFQEQVVKFMTFFKGPPIRDAFEVVYRD